MYCNGRFNLALWRSLLHQVIANIDEANIGLEIITPFGFEVTQNRRFLSTQLRRFYCYIGIPASYIHLANKIATQFDQALSQLLAEKFPNFYASFVLKAIQDQFIKLKPPAYECQQTDKLLDIQCRSIRTSLLDDYADYLICSLSAIAEGKDEPKHFLHNRRFRNRTYQLYVILENIFSKYVPKFNTEQSYLFYQANKKISNQLQIFYDDKRLHQLADPMDKKILQRLILPRITNMVEQLSVTNDILTITAKSYHIHDELQLSLSQQIYRAAKNHIIQTYLTF